MADIIPLHRGARRKIEPAELAKIVRGYAAANDPKPVDLSEWLNRGRRERFQRAVAIAALVVAGFCFVYFLFQLGRGVL